MEHGSIMVSKKAVVSASISLAEDTDHDISSSKKCDRSHGGPTSFKGLEKVF